MNCDNIWGVNILFYSPKGYDDKAIIFGSIIDLSNKENINGKNKNRKVLTKNVEKVFNENINDCNEKEKYIPKELI